MSNHTNHHTLIERDYANVLSHLKELKTAVKLLETIERFQNRKDAIIDNMEEAINLIPSLKLTYKNDLDTIDRCMQRYSKKYLLLISKIITEFKLELK